MFHVIIYQNAMKLAIYLSKLPIGSTNGPMDNGGLVQQAMILKLKFVIMQAFAVQLTYYMIPMIRETFKAVMKTSLKAKIFWEIKPIFH